MTSTRHNMNIKRIFKKCGISNLLNALVKTDEVHDACDAEVYAELMLVEIIMMGSKS